MPVRIKPVHILEPCMLNLSSIRGICKLIDENFNVARYSAEDGVWEVYDETSENFLDAITATDDTSGMPKHETLDSFIIEAKYIVDLEVGNDHFQLTEKEIRIIFSRSQATVKFSGPQGLEGWFEHFMADLRKNFRPPNFRQRLITERDEQDNKPLNYPKIVRSVIPTVLGSLGGTLAEVLVEAGRVPYCQIILYKKPPNAMVENVKAGLITNFLWVPIVFIFGILFTIFAFWIWSRYNVNVYDLITLPSIPTATPKP